MTTNYRVEIEEYNNGNFHYYPMYSREAYWPFRLWDNNIYWNYFFNVHDNAIEFSSMYEATQWLDSQIAHHVYKVSHVPYNKAVNSD